MNREHVVTFNTILIFFVILSYIFPSGGNGNFSISSAIGIFSKKLCIFLLRIEKFVFYIELQKKKEILEKITNKSHTTSYIIQRMQAYTNTMPGFNGEN